MVQISKKLDEGEEHIKNNRWDEVGILFTQAVAWQEKIASNEPSPDAMSAKNAAFKKEYEAMKNALLAKTKNIISLIENWRVEQTTKISGSKNVLNSLSNYYKPGSGAYYIDTKE